ncbi:hypothetical protein [Rhodanobacter hydrolyticus]|uniref:DUF4304 domain-containing protein n=1 Tax=Rhodanobacter hydrolyticus TaxID=2250595 RepID=A0ABW8J4I0_9GAMM
MKSTEVYSQLRAELGPWLKSLGFKRAKGLLSWSRQYGEMQTVVWFQISQSGWEAYSGSQFVVEFQRSLEPRGGTIGGRRQRLAAFLSELEREEVRSIQNSIIASLSHPPHNHPFLHVSPTVSEHYLKQFRPVTTPYSEGQDIWFRYASPEHVGTWSKFFLRKLPQCFEKIEAMG